MSASQKLFDTLLQKARWFAYEKMTATDEPEVVQGGPLVYDMAMYLMKNDLQEIWEKSLTNKEYLRLFYEKVLDYARLHISFDSVDMLRAAELFVAGSRGIKARQEFRFNPNSTLCKHLLIQEFKIISMETSMYLNLWKRKSTPYELVKA